MIVMDIPHLDLWEKYILAHARCQPQQGSFIELPVEVAKAMSLVKTEESASTVTVDHGVYWNAIFSQGHVSNLILLYAIGGKQYDNVRYDLTLCHLAYLLDNEPAFADWKDAMWLNKIFDNKTSIQVLAPMMVKWLRDPISEEDAIRYQQALPLYLYLGDFTATPQERLECRNGLYGLVSGTFMFGDVSWKGVYYDISKSRSVFKWMVGYADQLIAKDNEKYQKKHNWFKFLIFRRSNCGDAIYQRVGNWLSFCAYITLLSKYQRYALDAEGFRDAKKFVGTEVTRYYEILREKIG